MSGKSFHLTPLESRKQLLVVESELNRLQLLNEVQGLKQELGHLRPQVQAISSLATSAASLTTTFSTIANIFSPREGQSKNKSSWLSAALNGLKIGASLWEDFKSHQK